MTTLENLYYGNIDPANKYIKCGSEYSKLLNLLMRNEEKLVPTLSKEHKVIFEKTQRLHLRNDQHRRKILLHPRLKTRHKNRNRILPHRLSKFQ